MADGGIGAAVRRVEDERLITGRGSYTADVLPAAALEAVFVRSPHAAADILAVDVAAAAVMPGVVAVFTGADVVAAGLGSIEPLVRRKRADGSDMRPTPRPPLAADRARFVGDPVALVLAETAGEAHDAAEAVAVDWAERPAVVDIAAAMQPGAPLVWDEHGDNAAFVWEAGDAAAVAACFAAAAHVVRRSFRVSRVAANPMEPRAAVASYDAASGRYDLEAAVQAPWQTRAVLARVLGIAPERLRVHCGDVGGSFGMKGQTFPEYAALLFAAERLRRPLRWVCERGEGLVSDDQGRDVVMEGELALDAGGRFLALRVEGLTALGAYLSTRGTMTAVDNVPGVAGVYRIGAIHARFTGVHTNTPSISPYRGAGRPEAAFLIESLVDAAARETGRDPLALRRLNTLTAAEMPHPTPLGFIYDSGDFAGILDRAVEVADVAGFAARRAASEARGLRRGLGVANVVARSMAGQFETATLALAGDGTATLTVGSVSHGQGHATIFRQILAEELGLAPERVRYRSADSDMLAAGVGTFGSRSAGLGGAAVRAAAAKVREAAAGAAARRLNRGVDELAFRDGAFVAPDGARLDLAAAAGSEPGGVAAEARYTPDVPTFPNGCHVVEVEVDPETGAVAIDRYAVVEDVGTVLNPMLVKGQIHGGIAQGVGQVLMEAVRFDPESGQPLAGSFMDYAMPRASDLPMFTVESRPVPTPVNPLGVKGGGEGGTIGALPAVTSAILDALAPLGVAEIPMPATPSAVWAAIRRAGRP